MRLQYWKSDAGGAVSERAERVDGKVIFLPFAGAHRNSYRVLQEELTARHISSTALELPGHGSRIAEPYRLTIEEMVDDLFPTVRDSIVESTGQSADSPVVLFGHSMGALLAWGVIQRCRNEGLLPDALVISGRAGPGRGRCENVHLLPRKEFVRKVLGFGGSPREVLEDPEMLDLIEPPLRADFRAVETHRPVISQPVDIPVYVLYGEGDTILPEEAGAWRSVAGAHFEVIEQRGGHFHLFDRSEETVGIITRIIDSHGRSITGTRAHNNHPEYGKVDQ